MTRPNSVTTNYTYDNLSRLTSVLHQLSGSTIDGGRVARALKLNFGCPVLRIL